MSQLTIGSYVLEKAKNMQKWLEAETSWRKGPIPLTEIAAVSMAQKVHEMRTTVYERDWLALEEEAESTALVRDAVAAVRQRPELHDKFWRYLQLFTDTMATSN